MNPCPGCGAELKAGAKFCAQCGTPIAARCASCGAELEPGDRFCAECGTPAGDAGHAGIGGASGGRPVTTVSERRLVSVLFADLVGFTTLSEHRDPEEVRELLADYFDRSSALIARYGGTVEKFIGDAVMAVWGTPVAREDDAERAVRAALSLTQAVTALGVEVGLPELRLRAGVLTGNAAVELGAENQGMVLGDTVNTASRLQSVAAPGTVLVDDVTRRASEAAIAYEAAGEHQLKGREQPVRAWTALRVVAGAGGARRSAGLEAPFVGRGAELQTLIDVADESAREGRARLVAVVGEAGFGKSRLLWEFFKYLDGISEVRWWHQGRCLSYGEGVAYWALAEMVRARAGISEEDPPPLAREKLRACVEEHVADERERRLVEPRLAHLLRLEERADADRADLFSGWRLFFERLAQAVPVTMVFEDLQWADTGLLEFIDYLLEWSAEHPIMIIALGRPELHERRPGWNPLTLAALEPTEIAALLDGLAPGLPPELVTEISRRAEGIPLYAVETIRMLQDRGLLVQEDARYVLTGDVSELEVPETLHALVASRLDGLSVEERTLLQNAAVLGHTFSAEAVASLSERPLAEVIVSLDGLVTKQVLSLDQDPRSPERGQYAFLQALLRTVAYGTLARRTRKARHLAAARYLEASWPGERADIAEVLAAHYLEAIRAEPDADDVAQLQLSARETLTAAGRAAASLALGHEAERYFEQAAELVEDPDGRAALFEQAGDALWRSGENDAAERRLRLAYELRREGGSATGGTAAVQLAELLRHTGGVDEAGELLAPFEHTDDPELSPALVAVARAGLAAQRVFSGRGEQAGQLLESALTTLEAEQAWPELASALIARGIYLIVTCRRPHEARGALREALRLAEEHDLVATGLRARYNLATVAIEANRFSEAVAEVRDGIALARERGDRRWHHMLRTQQMLPLAVLGRWDEAISDAAELGDRSGLDAIFSAAGLVGIAVARGDAELTAWCVAEAGLHIESPHVDGRACAALVMAQVALGRAAAPEEILERLTPILEFAIAGETISEAYDVCVEAVVRAGAEEPMRSLAAWAAGLPPLRAVPMIRAGRLRLEAALAARGGDEAAARAAGEAAVTILRELGARPLLARTLRDIGLRHDDAGALGEARAIMEELGAVRWLAELDRVGTVAA